MDNCGFVEFGQLWFVVRLSEFFQSMVSRMKLWKAKKNEDNNAEDDECGSEYSQEQAPFLRPTQQKAHLK